MLNGHKTYLVAAATVVYAISGWLIGQIDGAQAGQLILESAAIASLRHAFTTGA